MCLTTIIPVLLLMKDFPPTTFSSQVAEVVVRRCFGFVLGFVFCFFFLTQSSFLAYCKHTKLVSVSGLLVCATLDSAESWLAGDRCFSVSLLFLINCVFVFLVQSMFSWCEVQVQLEVAIIFLPLCSFANIHIPH